jgi:steroid 5-alpha reductase family enzyme
MNISKSKSLLIILLAYVVAFVVAFFFTKANATENHLVNAALADLLGTVVIFMFSVVLSNSSTYDPYWSVAPFPIALYWYIANYTPEINLRHIIVLLLLFWWGARLTYNWARGWTGLSHEDWRYRMLAEKTGNAYWAVSFLGIHFFPTVMVFLGLLPVYVIMISNAPLNIIDAIAIVVTTGAILIETVSDNQLRKHVLNKDRDKDMPLNTGLWKYSRHPNYFGEISFWGGFFIFALAISTDLYWTGIGFLAMVILFVFISIPMMEKRQRENKPGYESYRSKVSMLIPWPPKSS